MKRERERAGEGEGEGKNAPLPRTLPGVQPSPGFRACGASLDFEGTARVFNGRPCAYVCLPLAECHIRRFMELACGTGNASADAM